MGHAPPHAIISIYTRNYTTSADANRILVMVSVLQAGVIAFIAYYPMFTLAGAALLSVLFTISSAATFALIPVLASGLE